MSEAIKNAGLSFILVVTLAALPITVFADFNDASQRARFEVASYSQQQLDGLNARVFTDAFLTAKIIGFDPAEITQLRAEMQALRQENARLSALVEGKQPVAAAFASVPSSSLEARVSVLERGLTGLQSTLQLVVSMLTMLLPRF